MNSTVFTGLNESSTMSKYVIDMDALAESPFTELEKWYRLAEQTETVFPSAMTLATVDADHKPHARIVLMKSLSPEGISFFTNYHSKKADNIADNQQVALVFYWPSLLRQVRIEGVANKTTRQQSADYFATRPKGNQLGAYTSKQSQVIVSRQQLLDDYQNVEQQFVGSDVPCPNYWGGYTVKPDCFEFWQIGDHRLHDRVIYHWQKNNWQQQRLAP